MREPPAIRYPLAAILLLAASVSLLPAQITFQRTYGGEDPDRGYSVVQSADGGYVIAGYTMSYGAGSTDVWLVRTDATGDTTWTRTYGGTFWDWGTSVAQTADGGWVITGTTRSFGSSYGDVWLIKTDATGDTAWTRTYTGIGHDEGWSVLQTEDTGYIITGLTYSCDSIYHAWLIKTDATGDTTWTRSYGGAVWDQGRAVAQTADSGYVIAGYTLSFGAGSHDLWLVKVDASGETAWTRAIGGRGSDEGYSVAQTADRGYVIAGFTHSFGAGGGDVYLVKTDASGDTMWTRALGGAEYDEGRSVAQTADGGYVIAGTTQSFGAGWEDVWLIKTDSNGDTMWTRTYGGADPDRGYSVAPTTDGGYVVTGGTSSFSTGDYDVWLIKTDSLGHTTAVAETPEPEREPPVLPTHIRGGPIRIPGQEVEVFDPSGRRVENANALRPGVYLVRSARNPGYSPHTGTVPGFADPIRAKVVVTD